MDTHILIDLASIYKISMVMIYVYNKIKLSRLSQLSPRDMSMDFLFFRTMSGPCLDHVWSMFGLRLLPEQLEL